jgi:hypothetical protein
MVKKVRVTVEHDDTVGAHFMLDSMYRSGRLKLIKKHPPVKNNVKPKTEKEIR